MTKPTRPCTIDECDGLIHAHNLCGAHARRLKIYGDPLAGAKIQRRNTGDPCSVDDCGKAVASWGLCKMHYMRTRRQGEAGGAEPLINPYVEGMTEKKCTECRVVKPVDEYHRVNRASKYVAKCKPCVYKLTRKHQIKRLYGISHDEYLEMVESQSGGCAVCGSSKRLCIDHNHITGVVRKLLCDMCNKALGLAEDDPSRLRAMADYLEAH